MHGKEKRKVWKKTRIKAWSTRINIKGKSQTIKVIDKRILEFSDVRKVGTKRGRKEKLWWISYNLATRQREIQPVWGRKELKEKINHDKLCQNSQRTDDWQF